MATFILILKKATDEIEQVPEPRGLKQSTETFPLSSASTFLSSILIHLVTGELSPSLEVYLTISQYDLLRLHNDL